MDKPTISCDDCGHRRVCSFKREMVALMVGTGVLYLQNYTTAETKLYELIGRHCGHHEEDE